MESSQLVFRVKIVYSFEVLRTFDLERSDVQITHTHTHTQTLRYIYTSSLAFIDVTFLGMTATPQ